MHTITYMHIRHMYAYTTHVCMYDTWQVLLGRKDDDRGRNGRENPLFEAEINFEVWEVTKLMGV